MSSKYWIYLLLVLVAVCSELSSALRCYTCEDCDEQSQVKELVVCATPALQQPTQPNPVAAGVPSSNPSTNPSTSPSTSPAAAPATNPASTAVNTPAAAPAAAGTPSGASRPPATGPAAAPTANSEDEEDYESDEEDSVGTGTGTGAAAAAAPGPAAAGTATGAGAPAAAAGGAAAPAAGSAVDSDAEEDEDEDYDDRRRRRASRQVMTNSRAVCYIASLQLNGTEITNRGCTIVTLDADQSNACNSLYNGWEVAGCTVCEENGCNAPIHATSTGQFSSSSSRMNAPTELTLGVALLAIAMAFS